MISQVPSDPSTTQTKCEQSHTRETYRTSMIDSHTTNRVSNRRVKLKTTKTRAYNQVNTTRPTRTMMTVAMTKGPTKKEIYIDTVTMSKINTTTSLVNPSVTQEKGRVRTLTIGTRALKAIVVDIATKTSK